MRLSSSLSTDGKREEGISETPVSISKWHQQGHPASLYHLCWWLEPASLMAEAWWAWWLHRVGNSFIYVNNILLLSINSFNALTLHTNNTQRSSVISLHINYTNQLSTSLDLDLTLSFEDRVTLIFVSCGQLLTFPARFARKRKVALVPQPVSTKLFTRLYSFTAWTVKWCWCSVYEYAKICDTASHSSLSAKWGPVK